MKHLLLAFLYSTFLLAYQDSDFDGVDDANDSCPNSAFDTIVKANGCANSLGLTLSSGYSFSSGDYGSTQTFLTNMGLLNLEYRYKNLSIYTAFSYLNSGALNSSTTDLNATTSGFGDIYSGLSYAFIFSNNVTFITQAGVKFATANKTLSTQKNDYSSSATLAYSYRSLSLYVLTGYTFIGNTQFTDFNNVINASTGIGYSLYDFYLSFGYTYASRYTTLTQNSHTLIFNSNYTINADMFVSVNYNYGLSQAVANHSISTLLGISF